MTLVVQKDAVVVLTDSQLASYATVNVEKGGRLVAVPDSSTLAERLEAAREFAS